MAPVTIQAPARNSDAALRVLVAALRFGGVFGGGDGEARKVVRAQKARRVSSVP
jgi:hypothetical protein